MNFFLISDILKLTPIERSAFMYNLIDQKKWIEENLLNRKQASKITGQSHAAFSRAIQLGRIKPFIEIGDEPGPTLIRLYLKDEIEAYAANLQAKKQKQQ